MTATNNGGRSGSSNPRPATSCSAFLANPTTIRHQNSISHSQGLKRSQSDITVLVGLVAVIERVNLIVERVVILSHITWHPCAMFL